MIQLSVAAAFFVGIHFLIAGTRVRDTLITRYGDRAFRAGFSALSILGLLWLMYAYRHAPYLETWGQPGWFKPIAALIMFISFLLIVAGITTPSPTVVGGDELLNRETPTRGILRITRHPFLWGLALWAFAHLTANGDAAAFVLFGSLLFLSLGGTCSIDRKRFRAYGASWETFAAATSNIPFVAIAEGRNIWKPAEIGWWRPGLSLLLYLVVLYFHTHWFGVSALF